MLELLFLFSIVHIYMSTFLIFYHHIPSMVKLPGAAWFLSRSKRKKIKSFIFDTIENAEHDQIFLTVRLASICTFPFFFVAAYFFANPI